MKRGEKYNGKRCSLHPELNGLRHKTSSICTACVPERARKWRLENPIRNRNTMLIRKYGLTYIEFQLLFELQGNCCAICLGTVPGGSGDWAVDHDYFTKKIRGILCSPCNTSLGQFKDNPKLLEAGAAYLRKYA